MDGDLFLLRYRTFSLPEGVKAMNGIGEVVSRVVRRAGVWVREVPLDWLSYLADEVSNPDRNRTPWSPTVLITHDTGANLVSSTMDNIPVSGNLKTYPKGRRLPIVKKRKRR